RSTCEALPSKIGPMQIFLRNFSHGQGPSNSKSRIIMANAAGRSGFKRFGNEVIDLDIISERLEAMGKSLRDVELLVVPTRKLKLLPFQIGRRTRPNINDDVPNGSLHATHQLDLAIRSALIMHTSQSSPTCRVRYAVLRILSLKPAGRELFNA